MKVVITGASGRLGGDLVRTFNSRHEVLTPDHKGLDIVDFHQVEQFFEAERPDVVIHSAAIADADYCQRYPRLCYQVNSFGAQNLALASARHETTMVFISTDYVYDGTKGSSYIEFDPVNPINVYGQSKLAAENSIQAVVNKCYLIRTAWLFGEYGDNFLTSVMEAAILGKPIKAAYDQIGSPTCTKDLSMALLELIETNSYGIYHIVNPAELNWVDYAKLILSKAKKKVEIEPIRKEQKGPAPRPANTALENFCLLGRRIYEMPELEESIGRCVYDLMKPGGRFA